MGAHLAAMDCFRWRSTTPLIIALGVERNCHVSKNTIASNSALRCQHSCHWRRGTSFPHFSPEGTDSAHAEDAEARGTVVAEVTVEHRGQPVYDPSLSQPALMTVRVVQTIRIHKVLNGPMLHDPAKKHTQLLSEQTVPKKRAVLLHLHSVKTLVQVQKIKYWLDIERCFPVLSL